MTIPERQLGVGTQVDIERRTSLRRLRQQHRQQISADITADQRQQSERHRQSQAESYGSQLLSGKKFRPMRREEQARDRLAGKQMTGCRICRRSRRSDHVRRTTGLFEQLRHQLIDATRQQLLQPGSGPLLRRLESRDDIRPIFLLRVRHARSRPNLPLGTPEPPGQTRGAEVEPEQQTAHLPSCR